MQTNLPSPTLKIPNPPEPVRDFIDLPGTRLHYVTCGSGPPLIMVPATVSLISQWEPLAQFMGLRYTSHFFELPGHGKSSAYPVPFSSHLVPKTVEALVDQLGYETFNLMGFSFGGLLAMRTLESLQTRINKIILLAPMLNKRALKYSNSRKWVLKQIVNILKIPKAQRTTSQILQMESLHGLLISALSRFSNIDRKILESKAALDIPISTLDVLSYTISEILSTEYQTSMPYSIPCFFGMSVNDDLIEYNLTEEILRSNFNQLKIQKFYHPYHQPPESPTFQSLVDDYYPLLDMLDD